MAIVNRDLDSSQQQNVLSRTIDRSLSAGASANIVTPGVQTGITYVVANVPYPSQLSAGAVGSYGVSGSLVLSLWLYRFAGGFTSIVLGQTLAVTAYGTSGMQGLSIIGGSSYLLQQGDQLAVYAQGSGAAADQATVSVVIKALQDIRSSFGAT